MTHISVALMKTSDQVNLTSCITRVQGVLASVQSAVFITDGLADITQIGEDDIGQVSLPAMLWGVP
jgi:hypothetical protein